MVSDTSVHDGPIEVCELDTTERYPDLSDMGTQLAIYREHSLRSRGTIAELPRGIALAVDGGLPAHTVSRVVHEVGQSQMTPQLEVLGPRGETHYIGDLIMPMPGVTPDGVVFIRQDGYHVQRRVPELDDAMFEAEDPEDASEVMRLSLARRAAEYSATEAGFLVVESLDCAASSCGETAPYDNAGLGAYAVASIRKDDTPVFGLVADEGITIQQWVHAADALRTSAPGAKVHLLSSNN